MVEKYSDNFVEKLGKHDRLKANPSLLKLTIEKQLN